PHSLRGRCARISSSSLSSVSVRARRGHRTRAAVSGRARRTACLISHAGATNGRDGGRKELRPARGFSPPVPALPRRAAGPEAPPPVPAGGRQVRVPLHALREHVRRQARGAAASGAHGVAVSEPRIVSLLPSAT